jgi:prepilin-type N-terminal cleavage/methylation domain-containing protein/prepilin-type processing-associated H-X9-DG protein
MPASPRRSFSLIELLVCIAIMAVLLAILLPGLAGARARSRGVKCASNLRQLGQAFQMYAGEYRGQAMPLAYTAAAIIGDGPPIYWWGTNDDGAVDHTCGFVWPYLRSELRAGGVYECPDQPWGAYIPQGAARAVTSTYGYNGYFLCPPHTPGWCYSIGDRPWQNLDTLGHPQRLFVFADTAIDLGQSRPQNDALLDPPYLYTPGGWTRNSSPTTCFRHAGRAVVVLADGHAAAFDPQGGRITSPRFDIGSVGADNGPYYVPNWRDW